MQCYRDGVRVVVRRRRRGFTELVVDVLELDDRIRDLLLLSLAHVRMVATSLPFWAGFTKAVLVRFGRGA